MWYDTPPIWSHKILKFMEAESIWGYRKRNGELCFIEHGISLLKNQKCPGVNGGGNDNTKMCMYLLSMSLNILNGDFLCMFYYTGKCALMFNFFC